MINHLLEGLEGIIKVEERKPVTFILGDNMAFLRKMRDEQKYKYFHVGIVDPPYGISVGNMSLGATNASKPRNYEMGKWDGEVPSQEYWDLLWYSCRNLIVWGGNYFTDKFGQTTNPNTETHSPIIPGRCFIVWDKLKRNLDFADAEIALTTFDKNARIISRDRNKGGDDEAEKRHPTQKPVYLYDYSHLNFVEKGQRVLDTHGGSFTHAVAAYKNNINLTIIDREESYFNSGLKNYDNASTKGRLLF